MSLMMNHSTAIDTTEYKSINTPTGLKSFRGFTIHTTDESGFYMSHDGGTTVDYYPDGKFSLVLRNTISVGDSPVELCKVKGTSSTTLTGVIL